MKAVNLILAIVLCSALTPTAVAADIDPEAAWQGTDHPRPLVRLQRLADFILVFPHHPNTETAIAEILDKSRSLPCAEALRLLDDVEYALLQNPGIPLSCGP